MAAKSGFHCRFRAQFTSLRLRALTGPSEVLLTLLFRHFAAEPIHSDNDELVDVEGVDAHEVGGDVTISCGSVGWKSPWRKRPSSILPPN